MTEKSSAVARTKKHDVDQKHNVDYRALEKIHEMMGSTIPLDPYGHGHVLLSHDSKTKLNNYRKFARRALIAAHSAAATSIAAGGIVVAVTVPETALLFPAMLVSMIGPVFNIIKAVTVHDRSTQNKVDYLVYEWAEQVKKELLARDVHVEEADVPQITLGFVHWALGDRPASNYYLNKLYYTTDGRSFSLGFKYDDSWEVYFHQRQASAREKQSQVKLSGEITSPLLDTVMRKIELLRSHKLSSEDSHAVGSIFETVKEAETLTVQLKELRDTEHMALFTAVLKGVEEQLNEIVVRQQNAIKNKLSVISRDIKVAVEIQDNKRSFDSLPDPGRHERR